jgi:DNA polymerase-4
LFFVGGATEKKLRTLGITTIGKLAKADPKLLKAHLKKQGEVIYRYANGIDDEEVAAQKAANKGYGNATTIPYDVGSAEKAKLILLSLCETVCTRLRADGVKASCLSISIVDMYFERYSHQKALWAPTNGTHEIYTCICQLFEELWDHKTPIRQLGVSTSKVTKSESYQCNLFDTHQSDKYEKLDKAIDQIRNKYGEGSILRAPFLNPTKDEKSKIKEMH